jgi:zinc protease
MKRITLSLSLALIGSGLMAQNKLDKNKSTTPPVNQGPKFIEEVKKTGNEVVIPYKKYKLPNGLTILVHEDHSDPMVYTDVTYHVGSAREQEGRSGFAHFFEHMMFQGSKNVGDEQHFKIITEAGGTLNGTTNTDRTNYFEVVPSNQLEKMLWLESDRMGFLLDSVTQRKFEVQRATVKNERGQRYDNAPYGLVNEKMGEALYPKGHPYSWSTIGYLDDLDRVDVNDLKRFYMRWYGPNNAVLTVAGDVKTEDVLKLAEKYFGSIKTGAGVTAQKVKPVVLTANRYISYEDNVKFPLIKIAYPTVANGHKDIPALDALGEILSSNQSSPFYKAFIETKKALSANAYNYSRELAGQFEIQLRVNQGSSLAEIEKDIRKVLEDWAKVGATDDGVAQFKASYNSGVYDALTTIQGKGQMLASNTVLGGNSNLLKKEMAMVNTLTKADIMRVYNTYIKNKFSVVLSCVPKGKSDLKAAADNWTMYKRTVESESEEYKNLSFTEPKDNFDRSKMPKADIARLVPVPNYYTDNIGKIKVIGVTDSDIPKVNLMLSFRAGHRFEPKDKSGVANLLAAMLSQSTTKTSAEEIENKLNRLGSSVSINGGGEEIVATISCLKNKLDATLAIIEESLLFPKFDTEEFEIEKKQQTDGIIQGQTNASVMAENAYSKLLYGNDHIMSVSSRGSLETNANITIEDVKNYYKNLSVNNLKVIVSGDVDQKTIVSKLAFLSKLNTTEFTEPKEPALPTIDKTRIYFIDKKGAAQSEIRAGYIATAYSAYDDFYRNNIMNFAFGGAFNSRVNYLMREIKGWTYGCRTGFSASKYPGAFTFSGGFKSNTTDSTLKEFMNEIKKYADSGINTDELEFTKNSMAQSDALKYESPIQKLLFLKRLVDYDLERNYVAKQTEILNGITKEEVSMRAKKFLPYNNLVIVVVGDKATNLEKVKALGYEVVEMDVNGNKIN